MEWPDAVVGKGQPEAEVVQAFLKVMRWMQFTMRQTATGSLKKFIRPTNKQHAALQSELPARTSMALEEFSATSWTAAIPDYAEARPQASGNPRRLLRRGVPDLSPGASRMPQPVWMVAVQGRGAAIRFSQRGVVERGCLPIVLTPSLE